MSGVKLPQAQEVLISSIKKNPNNPRLIKDDKFRKLKKSIQEFPQMLSLRPIVVDADNVVLGGNMRLEALKALGYKTAQIIKAEDLTEEQKNEFIIKDNVSFGEWDFDKLGIEFELNQLDDWGLDLPDGLTDEDLDLGDSGLKTETEEDDDLLAIIIVAHKDLSDLDRITEFYGLESKDIPENVKESISKQRKMYVYKK